LSTVVASQALPLPTTEGITAGARRLLFLSGLLLVPASVGAWFVGGLPTVVGVALGGGIALVNFWLLARLVVKSTSGVQTSAGSLVARLTVKFGLVGLLLALGVLAFGIDGFGLLLGLSVTFAAVPLNLFSQWVVGRELESPRGQR
jgi:hypothetical protein